MFFKLVIGLCCVVNILGDNNARNITDLSKCRIHYSKAESSYTKFFRITDKYRGLRNSSFGVTTGNTSTPLEFDFHFSVLGPSDAHILVAPTDRLQRSDPVYEIVLGAGGNTFSDIRRLQKTAVKATARTKGILSPLDVKSFWLHIYTNGLIEVGREHEELAFLTWRDPNPLPVEVFSFNTWPGIEAKWYYDCPRESGQVSTSEEIKKPLSDFDRLKKHVLYQYDPYVRPVLYEEDLMFIDIEFYYNRIHLDDHKAKMSIGGTMRLSWVDEKINWNKSDFGNISKLHLFHREIWQPNLVILNPAGNTGSSFLKSTLTEVDSKGNVTWKAQAENIEVWCDAGGIDNQHWPADTHTCEIQLDFFNQPNCYMVFTALVPRIQHSDWDVLEVSVSDYFNTDIYDERLEASREFRMRVIRFKIQRKSGTYTAIYFPVLITVSISMLLTFCLSPMGPYRIFMNCTQLILLCMTLANLCLRIPMHYSSVPHIVSLYSYCVSASLLSLAISVIMINLTRVEQTKPFPQFLYKILTSYYLRIFVSLSLTKSSDSYDNLVADNTSSTSIEKQESWNMLGKAIDRLMFVIYFIGICVEMFKSY